MYLLFLFFSVPNLIGNSLAVVYCFTIVLLYKPVYKRMSLDVKRNTESSSSDSMPPDLVS